MIQCIAVQNYRSLRDIIIPAGPLTLVSGANGSGKSNVYKALSLLRDASRGAALRTIAEEGGWDRAFWAGPEVISRRMLLGEVPVQGSVRSAPARIKVGVSSSDFGYLLELGLPQPPVNAVFARVPEFKREVIWSGGLRKPSNTEVERRRSLVARGRGRAEEILIPDLWPQESFFDKLGGLEGLRSFHAFRIQAASWRFHDALRTDRMAPSRQPSLPNWAPSLDEDGANFASAVATILDIGDRDAFAFAVDSAFPGSKLHLDFGSNGLLGVVLSQPGMLRPLHTSEWSDGTLRYFLLLTSMFSPRLPTFMVFNEPENSLHPSLIRPLALALKDLAKRTQVWVISHNPELCEILRASSLCEEIRLEKELGATTVENLDDLELPAWSWS